MNLSATSMGHGLYSLPFREYSGHHSPRTYYSNVINLSFNKSKSKVLLLLKKMSLSSFLQGLSCSLIKCFLQARLDLGTKVTFGKSVDLHGIQRQKVHLETEMFVTCYSTSKCIGYSTKFLRLTIKFSEFLFINTEWDKSLRTRPNLHLYNN